MTTVFHITLRPILILSKCFGLIDISYTVQPTGLLNRNINSTFPAFLEISRMIMLLICTYVYWYHCYPEFHILQIIVMVKFWIMVIAARLSTFWIIKFINGIIEFDRKCTSLSTNLVTPQRAWTKKHWNTIFILLFVYFIGFKAFHLYSRSPKIKNIVEVANHAIFNIPFAMDYVVTISSCFFLQNMYVRFQTLNDLWKSLPADLAPVSGHWTHIEIVDWMENTRLLHSELCELLKIFSLGYGPLLLGFYAASFVNMLVGAYFMVNGNISTAMHLTTDIWETLLPLLIQIQIVTFLMSIIVFASFINDKRIEIISILRLYRISNLHLDIKRQVLVLLISGIITLIQMKNHPIMEKIKNDTTAYFSKRFFKNIKQ